MKLTRHFPLLQHLHGHHRHYLMPNQQEPIPERQWPEGGDRADKSETLKVPDYLLCPYCPFHGDSPEMLGAHIESRHCKCTVQCSDCFFRASDPKMVSIHAQVAHPTTRAFPLDCPSVAPSFQHRDEEKQLTVRDLPPYRCCVADCSFACIHRATFISHLTASHPDVKEFTCRLCQQQVTCTGDDYATLMVHMNTHGIGLFQCAFCRWGTDLPADMLLHMCLTHPSSTSKVLLRSSDSGLSANSDGTLSSFWTPNPANMYSNDPSRQINFNGRFLPLFRQILVVQSCLTSDEDTVPVPAVAEIPVDASNETNNTDADVPADAPADDHVEAVQEVFIFTYLFKFEWSIGFIANFLVIGRWYCSGTGTGGE